MFDAFFEGLRYGRSEFMLTLGELINELEAHEGQGFLVGLHEPHSYRGYYEDLALSHCPDRPLEDLLNELYEVQGKTLQGYKGGYFLMEDNTPLWEAYYGSTGDAILGVSFENGHMCIETKEYE